MSIFTFIEILDSNVHEVLHLMVLNELLGRAVSKDDNEFFNWSKFIPIMGGASLNTCMRYLLSVICCIFSNDRVTPSSKLIKRENGFRKKKGI